MRVLYSTSCGTRLIAYGPQRPSTPHTGESYTSTATSADRFADRSGGLITFQAESGAAAEALVANDPFLRERLLEHHWVKEALID
jgi:uncharacterized protein YciI